jgi:hypothetical protein
MRRAQLRGALILGAAVVLGVVLLAQGDDFVDVSTAEVSAGQRATTTTSPTTTAPATTAPTTAPTTASTTTTTAPDGPRPPAEVQVLVLNGTTRRGVAVANSQKLDAADYQTPEEGNTAPRPNTTIFFDPSYEADARAVQQALAVPAAFEAMPDRIIDGEGQNVAASDDVDIIVILGEDLPQG